MLPCPASRNTDSWRSPAVGSEGTAGSRFEYGGIDGVPAGRRPRGAHDEPGRCPRPAPAPGPAVRRADRVSRGRRSRPPGRRRPSSRCGECGGDERCRRCPRHGRTLDTSARHFGDGPKSECPPSLVTQCPDAPSSTTGASTSSRSLPRPCGSAWSTWTSSSAGGPGSRSTASKGKDWSAGSVLHGVVVPPLPYRMRIRVELTRCEPPEVIDAVIGGDLKGRPISGFAPMGRAAASRWPGRSR